MPRLLLATALLLTDGRRPPSFSTYSLLRRITGRQNHVEVASIRQTRNEIGGNCSDDRRWREVRGV